MKSGGDLVTSVPIRAVVRESTHSEIVEIPEGSTIKMVGESDVTGMVEVEWNGRRHAMFVTDLEERCARLSKRA